jgi:hypothetical protein
MGKREFGVIYPFFSPSFFIIYYFKNCVFVTRIKFMTMRDCFNTFESLYYLYSSQKISYLCVQLIILMVISHSLSLF